MRALFIALRAGGAVAITAAIVGQLLLSLSYWSDVNGITDPTVQVVNFFSFFTIESNALTVAVFVVGAILLLRGSTRDPRWFGIARACVTAYMATTGIVYNLLLRGIDLPQGSTLDWSNEVLHVAGPLLIVLDWLLAPGRLRLEWKHIGIIVIFPIVWAVYTMVRGPLVYDAVSDKPFWYPYPFLNPNIAPTGYLSVAFYVVLIAVVIAGVGALIIRASRMRERWPLPAR